MTKSRAGFTLVEVMVSAAISAFVIAGVFAFSAQEARLLGSTGEHLDLFQAGRATLTVLEDDLRHAGGGIGQSHDGTFFGITHGNFAADGVSFNSRNHAITLEAGTTVTDDIIVMSAVGGQASIANYNSGGALEICAGSGIQDNELVVLRTPDSLSARSVVVHGVAAKACTAGVCVSGCEGMTFDGDLTYLSDSGAATTDYNGGEISGQLRRVVWFVEASDPDHPGIGSLRRAIFDNTHTCTARDQSCGDLIAENVESLQLQLWQWNTTTSAWVNVTNSALRPDERIRVDIELVIRARISDDREHDPAPLRLEPGTCIPACNTKDRIRREVFRTSVEIKNSGRMALR
ncbi:MAG: prepilin-type N-terminal cleavage/methylation domain-containing protein [Deltaproteobacteria bacterium]|nr:prepilin-type N-terminal cleavage/methylation domain-containing protein [Deltaproteobacteria bacterium]